MKKGKNIFIITVLVLIGFIILIFFNINNYNKIKSNEQEYDNENKEDKLEKTEEANEIERIKESINAKGKTDIYQIETERDGRKIIQIKPEVQFDVDLAGIIKNGKPEENEIENLLEKRKNGKGIWIEEQSRDKFMNLLENNSITEFYINEDGFLNIKNENISNSIAKKLKNMIESERQYIVSIKGKSYERDYITGEIMEYPFEEMDPQQIVETYEKDNSIILELTQNKHEKLTNKEILEAIVLY